VKPRISNMTALDRAFAAIWVRNPDLSFGQVMDLAKAAIGGVSRNRRKFRHRGSAPKPAEFVQMGYTPDGRQVAHAIASK
jgi:hypothetical protein